MSSYGGRVDANHADLRDNVFRNLCRYVIDSSQSGGGISDLLILTMDGELLCVEIKDGKKAPAKRRLTEMQKKIAVALGDKFLVATDHESAVAICTNRQLRPFYRGTAYILETEA